MGRYYGGDINGKFWCAVQDSNDASYFHVLHSDAEEADDVWECCGCWADEADEKCPNCEEDEASSEKRPSESEINYTFTNSEEQMEKFDDDLATLCKAVGFAEDESDLPRLRALADATVGKDWHDVPEPFDALYEACNNNNKEDVTDSMKAYLRVVEEMHGDDYVDWSEVLLRNKARLFLGLQIEAVLRKQDKCHFWCEC